MHKAIHLNGGNHVLAIHGAGICRRHELVDNGVDDFHVLIVDVLLQATGSGVVGGGVYLLDLVNDFMQVGKAELGIQNFGYLVQAHKGVIGIVQRVVVTKARDTQNAGVRECLAGARHARLTLELLPAQQRVGLDAAGEFCCPQRVARL